MYLFKKREVAAALSEAQQQREDVNGAGCLARARPGRVSLGHTELLGHWSEKTPQALFLVPSFLFF